MTNQHPITPPLSLINQWWDEAKQNAKYDEPIGPLVATQATQWGADQELEACCHEVQTLYSGGSRLRAARRPKPPSLKEQALGLLNEGPVNDLRDYEVDIIRLALEALPE
jgi:hypothetical protein